MLFRSGKGRTVIVGNRRVEGTIRRNQCFVEVGRKFNKIFIRPIINFDNFDIWQYIRENNLPYCSLYDEGFTRLGCVLCPFSQQIEREELYFPKIVANWKRACERIVAERKANNYLTRQGKPVKYRFETGEELYQWWVRRD